VGACGCLGARVCLNFASSVSLFAMNYWSSYFAALAQQLRSLSYVSSVECSLSGERADHACLVVDTNIVLTLSMITEIFAAVQKLVGDQSNPQIDLGPKTIILADLVYTRTTVETNAPSFIGYSY
jgi:hypothetical protein